MITINHEAATRDDVPVRRGRSVSVALWAGQIALASAFAAAGASKLVGVDRMVELFGDIGLGQWLRYATGTLELCGAILVLMPGMASTGAALLAAIMVGAVATHLALIGGTPAPALTLLAIAVLVAWGRRSRPRES